MYNAHLDVGESMGTKNEEMARNSMQGIKTVHWSSCTVPKEAFSFGQSSDGCHFSGMSRSPEPGSVA